jgi:hypothetical protein
MTQKLIFFMGKINVNRDSLSLQLEFNHFLSPISNQRLKRKKNKDLYQSLVYKKKNEGSKVYSLKRRPNDKY